MLIKFRMWGRVDNGGLWGTPINRRLPLKPGLTTGCRKIKKIKGGLIFNVSMLLSIENCVYARELLHTIIYYKLL